MTQFLNFLTGFFGTPSILIGIFALIGCLIQKKTATQTIISVIKTIIGFLIIAGGASIVSGAINKFSSAFELLFNRSGWIASNDNIPGMLLDSNTTAWIATTGSLILVVGMLLNLLLARISNLKFVYLTGHSAWYFSVMVASVFQITGYSNQADMWQIIILGSLLVSIWLTISPYLTSRHMKMISKQNNIAIAHTGSIGYVTSGFIGELVFKLKKGNVTSTESIRFPKGLNFLRNTNVSISLTMLILYLLIYFLCWGVRGFDAMVSANILADTDSPIVQGLLQAFTFAAGVEVILIGVRTFLNELMPAFKGISDKLIPGAIASVDCPISFTFAPNAVTIGFISSMIGGFIFLGINVGISSAINPTITWSAIILPSIIPHFFTGATAGVFGNAKGGILGCVLGAFINGLIISLVPFIFVGLGYHQWSGNIIWGDADFIIGVIPGLLMQYTVSWIMYPILITSWLLIPLVSIIKRNNRFKKDPEYKKQYYLNIEQNKTKWANIKTKFKEIKIELKQNKAQIKEAKLNKDKELLNKLYLDREKLQSKYTETYNGDTVNIPKPNLVTGTIKTNEPYKFVAVCGQGLGSSLIVEMNVKNVLKSLNIDNAIVEHTNLNSLNVNDQSITAIVIGKDLADSIKFDKKIVIDNLLDKVEISNKISEFIKNK